jgi:2-hydroxy-6-oxonona-2,4-dienedioate hydrolase
MRRHAGLPYAVARRIRVDGLGMFYRAWARPGSADATPLVLIHGLGVSSAYMVPLARRLAQRLPVFALDLPGFGRSDRPRRALPVPELAAWVGRWMEEVGVGRAVLAGHSLGCHLALDVAMQRPELAARLVLMSPALDGAERSVLGECAGILRDLLREPPALVALEDRSEENLPLVAVPALVLRGSRDPIVSAAAAAAAARRLPLARLHEVEGAAHALQFSAPGRVAHQILAFLADGVASASAEPTATHPAGQPTTSSAPGITSTV